jgi:hypothetical protein
MEEDATHHYTIRFINKSDKPIYIYDSGKYPDTIANGIGGVISQPQFFKAEPDTENSSALWRRSTWEYIFSEGILVPSDTLMIYTLDAELAEQHHITESIIQRYDLSLPDLQKLNWHVLYPPTEEMKNMKMYPKYGEN